MSLTFGQARDEILGIFHGVWDPRPADYPDVAFDVPTTEIDWARVRLRHGPSGQSTLSNDSGQRTFTRTGTLLIQVFTPLGNGLQSAYDLAKLIADAYEVPAAGSEVWYRDVSITEADPDGNFQQVNVSISFTYDEIK